MKKSLKLPLALSIVWFALGVPQNTSRLNTERVQIDLEAANVSTIAINPVERVQTVLESPVRKVEAAEINILPQVPAYVSISSIGLKSKIVKVGTDKAGRMDVPGAKTSDIGWYSGGAKPGAFGSAVLAAHNNAAFKNLRRVKIGDEIVVTGESGEKLTFKVDEIKEFALKDLSPEYLFNRSDEKRLTLITCSGKPTRTDTLFSHRLVVSATLVE